MKRLRLLWVRLCGSFRQAGRDEEIAAEIETHIQMQTEDNLRQGMCLEEARRAASLKFGSIESAKEAYRDQWSFPLIDHIRMDVRLALRTMYRVPSISVPVILVLALGIGVATALYAVVYAIWLQPLPYPDADRLVSVMTHFPSYQTDALLSPDYGTWQGTRSLGPLAAYTWGNATIVAPNETLEVERAQISGNLLEVLGVHVAAGRNIQPDDDLPKAPRVAVLSHRLWQQQFGAEASAIGRLIWVDGETCTIIGVLPRDFRMPDERRVDLLMPLAMDGGWLRHGKGGMKIMRGIGRLQPGFRTEHLITASVSTKGTRFAKSLEQLRSELREKFRGVPGIVHSAFADALQLSDANRITSLSRSDRPLPEPFQGADNVLIRLVDGSFFEAMGIPLYQGRLFTETDYVGDGLVAIVNRTLADHYFAGENALGKRVDGHGVPWKTVVGVVADTRNDGLLNPIRPEIYLPWTEGNSRGGGVTRQQALNVVIYTEGNPTTAISVLRGHLRSLDPALLARTRMMGEQWTDLRSSQRFQAMVFSGFAVLAVLMTCAGIYGVLSHVVIIRQQEIGIRMALGARPADIQGLIAREALILALAGVAIGLGGALASTRFLESLLYQVNPRNPLTLAAMAALLALLAMCASSVPALRASKQDPARILRAE